MKKYLILFVTALAGLTILSCQKEKNMKDPEADTPVIRFTAIAEGTKTVVDGSENWANWEASDQLKIVEYADGVKNKEGSAAIATLSTDHKTASFAATVSGSFPDGAKASYVAAYPANRLSEGGSGATAFYRMKMAEAQSPVVGSFDPNADILLSAPVKKADDSRVTDGDELTFSFHRLGTAVKLSLSGITKDEKLSKVTIKAPVNIAGYVKVDMTNGGYKNDDSTPYSSESDAVTLTFNEDDWVIGDAGTADVWFRILPCVWASGSKLEVTVETDKAYYYRTEVKGSVITLPEDYKFVDGGRTRFAVGLASAVREEKDPSAGLADGDYVILAKNGTTYYALKAEATGVRLVSVNYTGSTTSYDDGDEDIIWQIAKSGSGYTVKNGTNFLGCTTASSASLIAEADYTDAACLLSIVEGEGVFAVTLKNDGTKQLARNQSNSYFAFYANSQYKDIVFVPATVDPRTPVTLSFADDVVNLTTSDYGSFGGQKASVSPSVSAITSNISYAIASNSDNVISSLNVSNGDVSLTGNTGSATVNVSFAGDTNYRAASASYTINVTSATDAPFIRITEATYLTFEDGVEYLLVYVPSSGTALAFDGSQDAGNYSGGTDGIAVTFDGSGNIPYATYKDYALHISQSATAEKYYIQTASGVFIGKNANSNGVDTGSSASSNLNNGIAFASTGKVTITGNGGRALCYYPNNSNYKYYAASNCNDMYLYKRAGTPDTRDEAGMSWSASAATATYATGNTLSFTAPTLTQGNASSVTYSSSDETIATISAAGVVSVNLSGNAVKEGSTTISASFDGDADYKPQTVSYTLNVIDNRDAVATPTFNPAAGEVTADTEVAFQCTDSGVTFYYTTNGSAPTTASTSGNSVIIDVAKTVKVIAAKTGYKNSSVAEAAYTIAGGGSANDGSIEHPYTVAEALGIISGLGNNKKTDSEVYVSGIISSVGSYNSTYHSVTYFISDDGSSTNTVQIYSGKNIGNTDFSSNTEIAAGNQVVVHGYLYNYNGSTPEIYQNSYISSLNGTRYLTAPKVSTTPDNDNKKITVSWEAVDGAVSYDITCGTQSKTGCTALTWEFTMADYGTYEVQVTAKGGTGVVNGVSPVKSVTLTDPSSGGSSVDVTFVAGTDTSSSTTLSKDGVTCTITSGTFSRTDNYRVYASNSMTISAPTGKTLTKVVFTITQNTFTVDTGTWTDGTKTWTGSSDSVTFTCSGGQVRITQMVVTYE